MKTANGQTKRTQPLSQKKEGGLPHLQALHRALVLSRLCRHLLEHSHPVLLRQQVRAATASKGAAEIGRRHQRRV